MQENFLDHKILKSERATRQLRPSFQRENITKTKQGEEKVQQQGDVGHQILENNRPEKPNLEQNSNPL